MTLASESTLLSAVACDESVSGSGWQIGHEGLVLGVLVLMLPKEMGLVALEKGTYFLTL